MLLALYLGSRACWRRPAIITSAFAADGFYGSKALPGGVTPPSGSMAGSTGFASGKPIQPGLCCEQYFANCPAQSNKSGIKISRNRT